MSFKETFQWTFTGLDVNVYQCHLDGVHIIMKLDTGPNHTTQLVENSEIIIRNSSFRSLDLEPGTKAKFVECYLDAHFNTKPTLITANNSDVLIQSCHFINFVNEKGSTILFGQNNSHVTIENSVFIQHNSCNGVLFLYNNSSLSINSSLFSQNVAFTLDYSPITLRDRICAVVYGTVFRNNSALVGGAMIAEDHCNITLTDSTFSSNKAVTEKTLSLPNNRKVEMDAPAIDKNNIETFTPINTVLFNQALLHGKKVITAHPASLFAKSLILKHKSAEQKGGFGGAVFVAIQSQLLVTNCMFKDNLAQVAAGAIGAELNVIVINRSHFLNNNAVAGGVIFAGHNVTLGLQETSFVGNKALLDSGAIYVADQAHLRITNCVFEDNVSQRGLGGAIFSGYNVTAVVKDTFFKGNSALQGGALDVNNQSYLRTTNCTFEDNLAKWGGAIFLGFDLFCEINGSSFRNNSALQGGAINMQEEANVLITESKMEGNFASDIGGAILAAFDATLTLREAYFTFNNASDEAGALYVYQSECYITWCIFHSNTAKTVGGAVGISVTSSVTIENTNFTNNNSSDGGAIYIEAKSTLQANMSSFWKNFANQCGGAFQVEGHSRATIENCLFISNNAIHGGAVNLNSPKFVSVLGTLFLRNVASDRGGAVAIKDGTNVIIDNIRCVGNQGPRGGCLQIQSVILTLNNCEISDNFGFQYASGITAYDSKVQVGFRFFRFPF